jgi:hypothetical protein
MRPALESAAPAVARDAALRFLRHFGMAEEAGWPAS